MQSRNENAVTFYAEGGHHGRANSTGNEADVAGDEVVEEDKLEDIEDGSKFNPAWEPGGTDLAIGEVVALDVAGGVEMCGPPVEEGLKALQYTYSKCH